MRKSLWLHNAAQIAVRFALARAREFVTIGVFAIAPVQGSAQDVQLELLDEALSAAQDAPVEGLVSSANIQHYRRLFPPEVLALIKAGILEARAAPALNFEWRFDDDWIKASLESATRLSADGSPQLAAPYTRGFLFGPASSVKEEAASKARAEKILWNSQSFWWSTRAIAAQFDLQWTKSKQQWDTGWNLLRVYPAFFTEDNKSGQLFRESTQVIRPKEISGLALLSFRFIGSGEDGMWLYSPAIKRTRMLTGSNRADALLRSSASLDDLMVWSARPEQFEATVTETKQLLMPFVGLEMAQAVTSGSCVKIGELQSAERAGSAPIVHQTVSTGLGLPVTTTFIPREAFVIQARSKDPYSRVGREMLYVDGASMLPLYRETYNPAGQLWKVSLSSIGLASSGDGKRRYIYPSHTLILDRMSGESTLVTYRKISFCENLPPGTDLALFDPRKLGPEEIPTPSSGKKPPTPASETPEDER